MTAFYVGDVPAEDLVVEPARRGEAIDLDPFDTVSVVFRDPAGETIDSSGFLAEIDGQTVVVEWPDESVLDDPGPYELSLILESSGGFRETVSALRIIVQDPADGWHTLDTARDEWGDAPHDDSTLYDLLDVAKDAVTEYAPALGEDALPPNNYRKAQIMQARNVWNSDEVSPSGDVGMEGFTIRPHPLDWAIKQLLRPRRGVPFVT